MSPPRSGRTRASNSKTLVLGLLLGQGTGALAQSEPPPPAQVVVASPQSPSVVPPWNAAALPGTPSPAAMPITSMDQLLQLDSAQLNALYQSSTAVSVPPGRVKGRVLMYPGTRAARPASRVARLAWQGKIFQNDRGMAVNRFFGMRIIKGRVYQGASWLDGGPSLILDYQGTSRLYNSYRDEIREVGPGIYLGLMYERTEPDPRFKMYFALDARP